MEKIIDDFSVLAVEARLVQELPNLFSPTDVFEIDDATVATLAAEDEVSAAERTLCSEKLKILEHGLRELQSVQDYPLPLRGMTILCESTPDGTY
jgi:hypothetical protein